MERGESEIATNTANNTFEPIERSPVSPGIAPERSDHANTRRCFRGQGSTACVRPAQSR
jgi:hypothetical protein